MAKRVRIPVLGIYLEAPVPGSTYQQVAPGKPQPQAAAKLGAGVALDTEPAGSGPAGQGTRVPSPVFGTQNGPKQPPPRTQSGGHETVGIESATVQVRGWPANPAQPILAPSGSRPFAETTDHDLHTGPAPGHVLRYLFDRMRGVIGDNMMASFPYDGAWSMIPHRFIPRTAQGTGLPARSYDDNAPVPAVYAGNPRVG